MIEQQPPELCQQSVISSSDFVDLQNDKRFTDKTVASFIAVYSDGRCLIAKDKANGADMRRAVAQLEGILGLPLKRTFVTFEQVVEARRVGMAGRQGNSDADMPRRVLELIDRAFGADVSDIHIDVGSEVTTVDFRRDGYLFHAETWPSDFGMRFLGAAYTMADVANDTFSEAKYLAGRLAPRLGKDDWAFPDGLEALRMQFNPVAFGRSYAVFRLLTSASTIGSIESLGYEPEQLGALREFSRTEKGLGIIAGATGSGKSTTMCALLSVAIEADRLSLRRRSLFTIEDPPERRLEGAKQLVVPNTDEATERTQLYLNAIGAAMRSDPDRLMIGEIRDKATANLALSASITGHQVWTTLHCGSVHSIALRLVELGADRGAIFGSDELQLLTAQVLVPLLCPHCKMKPPEAKIAGVIDAEQLARVAGHFGHDVFVAGPGCDKCNGGIKGRTVLAEVVRPDADYLKTLADVGMSAARDLCKQRGEPSILEVGCRKVWRGLISPLDVLSRVDVSRLPAALLQRPAA
jgi:type II secretory ATPase GspE/PulE/Tfp pilus assembly ATPase PilB-like protein